MAISIRLSRARLVSIGLLAAVTLVPSSAGSKVDLPFKDLHGRTVHLKDLRGKPVVLNFWATWCIPCRAELPIFVELANQYVPRGIAFVAVSLDERETRPKIPGFIEKLNIDFPVWTGASTMDLADLRLGQALPATAFLDAEGRVVARIVGQVQRQEMEERLEWLSGGGKGPAPNPLVVHLGSN